MTKNPFADAVSPVLPALARGVQHALDSAQPEDLPHAVCGALRTHATADGLLSEEQRRGSAQRYTRHVLYSHPSGLYTIVALVWRPGQATPVHGHYTWCAYMVLKGSMREERFQWNGNERGAAKTGQIARNPGDVVASHAGLEEIHRLCNAGDDVAISIHVYGVDAQRVSTHVNRIARLL